MGYDKTKIWKWKVDRINKWNLYPMSFHISCLLYTSSQQFGIRMHYVRYNSSTFSKLSEIGYLFDTSELDVYKRQEQCV